MTATCLIHVVDDDEPVRASIAFALKMVGFRAATYIDAADFLARGQMERGLLLSDVRMDGMSGVELVRRLRQDGSNMPIILMTGNLTDHLETEAISAGADRVLAKPIALAGLVAEITLLSPEWD